MEAAKKLLGTIERVGNKVPHPVLNVRLPHPPRHRPVLGAQPRWVVGDRADRRAVGGAAAEYDYYEDTTAPGVILPDSQDPDDWEIIAEDVGINSLVSVEGVPFIFSSFVNNFVGFSVVAVVSSRCSAPASPRRRVCSDRSSAASSAARTRWALTLMLVLVGVISSVASGFAGVAAIFMVNIIFTPTDGMITEIANESIALAGGEPVTIVATYYFMIATSLLLSPVAALGDRTLCRTPTGDMGAARGEPGRPGRRRDRGCGRSARVALRAHRPLFIIMAPFLVSGVAYGVGAGTMRSANDVIAAIVKTFQGWAPWC
ncbi:hypothetical protein [Ornithinimicrobium sp. LYQ103]|uniref:hypothetical protein n=1 Tax=Ornithinimicrobium sp. LYQ103 TaxID=3378796 RepID=UPI003853B693